MTAGADKDLRRLAKAFGKYDRYLLTCHMLPEGDAIGSMLAMDSLLRRLGKKCRIVCQDPFPERLSCLSDRRWTRFDELKGRKLDYEAMVLTDCPTLERIGTVKKLVTPDTAVFNIDHHISNTRFGQYHYIRPEAAATAEVVFDIFKHLKVEIKKEDAKNLYVGLATDTGSFKYSNTSARSHRVAAELIETGIPIETINNELHGRFSVKMMNLYSRLFGRIRTAAGGAIAWVGMTQEDLRYSGASYEDAEGFIDFVRYMKKVKIAFFISELDEPGMVRVSFRAVGPYDVNKIATHFKGGGHKKAAGCKMKTSLKSAEKQIVSYLKTKFRITKDS